MFPLTRKNMMSSSSMFSNHSNDSHPFSLLIPSFFSVLSSMDKQYYSTFCGGNKRYFPRLPHFWLPFLVLVSQKRGKYSPSFQGFSTMANKPSASPPNQPTDPPKSTSHELDYTLGSFGGYEV